MILLWQRGQWRGDESRWRTLTTGASGVASSMMGQWELRPGLLVAQSAPQAAPAVTARRHRLLTLKVGR